MLGQLVQGFTRLSRKSAEYDNTLERVSKLLTINKDIGSGNTRYFTVSSNTSTGRSERIMTARAGMKN
jgi:hypothetical protein